MNYLNIKIKNKIIKVISHWRVNIITTSISFESTLSFSYILYLSFSILRMSMYKRTKKKKNRWRWFQFSHRCEYFLLLFYFIILCILMQCLYNRKTIVFTRKQLYKCNVWNRLTDPRNIIKLEIAKSYHWSWYNIKVH